MNKEKLVEGPKTLLQRNKQGQRHFVREVEGEMQVRGEAK